MYKKTQTSVEFLAITGILMLLVLIFLGVLNSVYPQTKSDSNFEIFTLYKNRIKNTADSIYLLENESFERFSIMTPNKIQFIKFNNQTLFYVYDGVYFTESFNYDVDLYNKNISVNEFNLTDSVNFLKIQKNNSKIDIIWD